MLVDYQNWIGFVNNHKFPGEFFSRFFLMLSASSHQDNVTKINNSLDALLWDTWDKQDEWVSHVILTSWKTCGCSTLVMYNLQFVICLDVPLYTSWNMFWTWERVQVCFAHQFSSISRILNLWIDVWLNNNLILIIDLKKKKGCKEALFESRENLFQCEHWIKKPTFLRCRAFSWAVPIWATRRCRFINLLLCSVLLFRPFALLNLLFAFGATNRPLHKRNENVTFDYIIDRELRFSLLCLTCPKL